MKYIKQFIVGSSFPSVFLFYYTVNRIKKTNPKKYYYTYYDYTLCAPIVLGIANVISFILAERFDLSYDNRFILITILLYLFTTISVHVIKAYNFNKNDWKDYYKTLLILYIIVWNYIIYFIEKSIK